MVYGKMELALPIKTAAAQNHKLGSRAVNFRKADDNFIKFHVETSQRLVVRMS